MARTLQIRATQPQADFHNLACKYPAFVGGFGTGKSETMANQAIMDASHSSDALIALYEPTYDLVRLIMAPRIQEKLSEYGIAYKYNKSENIIYSSSGQFGDFVLRTLDNPERIVGYESYRAHIDEIDTIKAEQAQNAWNKIVARNRQQPKGVIDPYNRVCAYSTPEGFRFLHKRWVVEADERYQMIQASTLTNPFLPDDYVDSLRATYPAELIDAYINGEFVNLTSGTVYKNYDRVAHDSKEGIRAKEPLFIGMDFNVTKQAATVYVKREGGKEWHAVEELVDMYDTPEACRIIKERWPDHKIYIYPDASGGSRKTVNASVSDISILEQAGFIVLAEKRNPAVKDRILAVNTAFEKGRLFVNATACPVTARCLEQQAYDNNGEPDKKSGNDHQNDATGYPVAYEMPVVKPMRNVVVNFAV